MSLVRAADLLGYDKNSLQAYEVGVRLPDVQFLAHAAKLYRKDFKYMLALLLRGYTLRNENTHIPDPVCAEAADQIKVVYHQQVLDPKSPLSSTLDHELLAKIIATITRLESKKRLRISSKEKGRLISALYGVAKFEGNEAHELGIEYLVNVLRDDFQDRLDGQ